MCRDTSLSCWVMNRGRLMMCEECIHVYIVSDIYVYMMQGVGLQGDIGTLLRYRIDEYTYVCL